MGEPVRMSEQPADAAVADERGGEVEVGDGAEFAVDAEDAPVLRGQVGEQAALVDVAGGGFSEGDVLAGLDGGDGHGDVPVVGGGDHDRVDVRTGEQFAEVSVGLARVVFVAGLHRGEGLVQPPGVDIAHRHDAAVGGLQEGGQVGPHGLAAHADHADVDLASGFDRFRGFGFRCGAETLERRGGGEQASAKEGTTGERGHGAPAGWSVGRTAAGGDSRDRLRPSLLSGNRRCVSRLLLQC
ncbi:MAG: hypothetical protein U1G05_19885 [Kiritimatiellia bacterium]